MFTSNPFAELTLFLPAWAMQAYILLMVLAVFTGTVFDMLHKGSARFFTQQWKKSMAHATRSVGPAETASLAIRTLLKEVATAGEFCNVKRRLSHLLMFYGFLTYLLSTVVLVFGYPPASTPAPAVWPLLWNLGALMVLAGGSWFFFFLRVDVAHEGHSPFRLVRADLFIVSLLASVTFALVWEIVLALSGAAAAMPVFALYILCTTLLFVGVPWSKFAHMFYKPAAALHKRVEAASGASDLPDPVDSRHAGR